MARYGPPDDPSNRPTHMANYGPSGPPPPGYGSGYDDQGSGEPPEPESAPTPWYRKRALLVAWGALVAILVALIIYGLITLSTGGGGAPSTSTSSTTSTTTSTATSTATTTPSTTTASPSSTGEAPPPPSGGAPVAPGPAPAPQPHRPHLPQLPKIPPTITLPHTVITLPPGI
ncbi:hypothetical protein H7K24_20280 [Mycobacterium fragae]|nr:hypothetical protein [Mycobacterium fragae]MCV7402481.1 hypothetical protein [Mycobacterium fragae]